MPMVDIDWLKDHVEVPEGLTYEQLAKDLQKEKPVKEKAVKDK